MKLDVRPVASRRDLTRFIKLPWRLYRNEPRWIPPLVSERRRFLDREKNPFFDHAEAEYFLAWRDGEPVGRISAHVDHALNEFQHTNWGLFGFFDADDDPEIAHALLDVATEWHAERGRGELLGPMDFTTNDDPGLLVEGHERRPIVLQNWHHPYYRGLLESCGLEKAMDLYFWEIRLEIAEQQGGFHPLIHATAEKVVNEHGVTIRHMRKSNFEAELQRFMDVYNAAWNKNWGFVPITDEQVRFYAKDLKPILDERWTWIAELDGEVIGAALTLPDVNQCLEHMNGRLLPIGWAKFLYYRRKIDAIRVFALGVKPEHQQLGVAAAFYVEHLKNGSPDGVTWGEMGWILETNEPMNRAMEGMGAKIVKRYRIYRK